MKYFMGLKCLEGYVPLKILGFNIPKWLVKPNNTIQPITIGIISSDNREYYAISKDFNLKEAWYRFQYNEEYLDGKEYWIRENVLKPIWVEKCIEGFTFKDSPMTPYGIETLFTYTNFKRLLNKCGKTNKQITEEVAEFIYPLISKFIRSNSCNVKLYSKEFNYIKQLNNFLSTHRYGNSQNVDDRPEFYGYNSNYDWSVFYQLFGTINELSSDFPKYINLKQSLDEKQESIFGLNVYKGELVNDIKKLPNYPKLNNDYHTLSYARFNFELYEFLQKL